ncbi:hypothetical protein AB0K60_25695 [Thermopolyspora sp. NPDC052614]|uniref:hypothetical protein n=1 Tax=Thermopolyspora sp. NPDC052614 TaxID=3155682 RepID=UPI00341F092B
MDMAMDMATVVVVIVSIATAKGCAALGLWLRWRVRQEQAKGAPLIRVAEALAQGGGRLEWDEQRSRGHRLQVRITRAPAGMKDSAA